MTVLGSAAQGAAYGSVAGPIGAAGGAVVGTLQGLFGSGQDGGPNYAPQHGGFSGPGYGQPGSPGFDANGLPYDQNNPAPGGGTMDARGNAFQWQGQPGGAAADAARYQGMGQQWGGINGSNDYSTAAEAAGMGNQARGSQADALNMMQGAANGNTPSFAEIQQRQGMDNAMGSQLAMAAGARGASGLAQANYNAAGNVAGLQRQAATQGSELRAQEMANARGAYGQMATGMRGQDLGFFNQFSQNAQANGQLGLGYRQLGAQTQLGYEGMGYNVNNAQYGGQQAQYGANQAAFDAQQQRNNQAQANANQNYATAVNGVGTVVKAAQGA